MGPATPHHPRRQIAKYLSDPAYRRKIARQLNKGLSLPALRRELHYAHQGVITKPHLADHTRVLGQPALSWCVHCGGQPDKPEHRRTRSSTVVPSGVGWRCSSVVRERIMARRGPGSRVPMMVCASCRGH